MTSPGSETSTLDTACSFGAGDSSSTITTFLAGSGGGATGPCASSESGEAATASMLRLENSALWAQVREHRQQIEALSQRLQAVQGATAVGARDTPTEPAPHQGVEASGR